MNTISNINLVEKTNQVVSSSAYYYKRLY